MEIDFHRTDVTAGTAQRAGKRQTLVGFWITSWSEDRTDGAWHSRSVAVTTAAPIDRAGIHARPAANAAQRPTELRRSENFASAIIDEDDVQLSPIQRAMEMG